LKPPVRGDAAVENDVMDVEESKAYAVYVAKISTIMELVGWGIFLALATMPLVIMLSFDVGPVCLGIYLASIFVASGIVFVLIQWATRAGIGLWINPHSVNPLGTAERLCFSLASGILAFSLLSSLKYYWDGILVHGAPMSEIWEFMLPFVIIGLAFIPSFPIIHIAIRFLKKRLKEERVRRKVLLVRKEDLEKSVVNALKFLGLSFKEVDEGTKQTGPLPSYKVKNHQISLRIFSGGTSRASVITIARAPEDYMKAEEIERSIDSFIGTLT
jgi:hypothetical protein